MNNSGWNLDIPKPYPSCPYTAAKIIVLPVAYRQVAAMMDEFDGEWLAYLDGYVTAQGNPVVTNLRIPKQIATMASVDVVDEWTFPENHIGVMHSHHNLGIGFSGTDDENINRNHPLSILVRWQGNNITMVCEYRQRVACGVEIGRQPPVVVQEITEDGLLEDFITEAKKQVMSPPPVPTKTSTLPDKWGNKRVSLSRQLRQFALNDEEDGERVESLLRGWAEGIYEEGD